MVQIANWNEIYNFPIVFFVQILEDVQQGGRQASLSGGYDKVQEQREICVSQWFYAKTLC